MPVERKISGGPLLRRVNIRAKLDDVPAMQEIMAEAKLSACSAEQFFRSLGEALAKEVAKAERIAQARGLPGYEHPSAEFYYGEMLDLLEVVRRFCGTNEQAWTGAKFAYRLGRNSVLAELEGPDNAASSLELNRGRGSDAARRKADRWRISARADAETVWAKNPNHSISAVARILIDRGLRKSARSVTAAIRDLKP
jgi:hypothetical protein